MNFYFIWSFLLIAHIPYYLAKSNTNGAVIDNISDIKDFKKFLRTKTNVLICFTSSLKKSAEVVKVFREAAVVVKGQGTMILFDCSGDAKKLCKKLKVLPEPHLLKHYKDGDFHKDYDRKWTVASMVNFMRDPAGDIPWEEDDLASNVVHVPDANTLAKLIKKESKPIMIMFYAPWCGFCKALKPDYSAAATELKSDYVLAAIDVNRPENTVTRTRYNITGFPTLLYYVNGEMKFYYEGDNNKQAIVNFMRNPRPPPPKIKEPDWSEVESDVVHLTAFNFDTVIQEEASILVMFYAPWCGHCKRMKPQYEQAAGILKAEGVQGVIAALDATKDPDIASRYSIKGYPTVKYFENGELKFDLDLRESAQLVEFMRDPKEPPAPPPAEGPWADEQSEVVHLNEETFKPFLKKKKHVLVMFYAPWCGHCKKAKPEFTRAAEHFKDDPKVEFSAVDCTTQQPLCSVNEIKGYPTIKYYSYYKIVKHYNGGRTEQDFISFMTDPDQVYSSTPPPVQDSVDVESYQNLVILNDDNFTDHISSSKPTLVMFHAPWCTHCKTMKPDYSKVADDLKSSTDHCTLATFDCTKNPEITEKYQISGFPTVKLFRSGKHIADYKGARSPDNIKQFINEQSKTKDEL